MYTEFNQWAEYLIAKTKVTHNNLPLFYSRCRDCHEGLELVNDQRVGHCADAGKLCQTNPEGSK